MPGPPVYIDSSEVRASASLERHLELGEPAFRSFADLVTLRSIPVYGEPSENALRQLHDKARMLGGGSVTVRPLKAGFARATRPRA